SVTVPHADHLYDGKALGEVFTAVVPMSVQGIHFQIIERKAFDVEPPIEIKSAEPLILVLTPQTDSRTAKIHVTTKSHLNRPFEGFVGAAVNNAGGKPFELASATMSLEPTESREVLLPLKMKLTDPSKIQIRIESAN